MNCCRSMNQRRGSPTGPRSRRRYGRLHHRRSLGYRASNSWKAWPPRRSSATSQSAHGSSTGAKKKPLRTGFRDGAGRRRLGPGQGPRPAAYILAPVFSVSSIPPGPAGVIPLMMHHTDRRMASQIPPYLLPALRGISPPWRILRVALAHFARWVSSRGTALALPCSWPRTYDAHDTRVSPRHSPNT